MFSDREGTVTGIDTEEIGWTVVHLGGGRTEVGQRIDHSVGITGFAELGQCVDVGDVIATVHAADICEAARAADRIRLAYTVN